MTSLLDLPPELLVSVATRLEDVDVLAFRRASRHLERCSFEYFARRFFSTKGFMVTSHSLDALDAIAHHEELRKSLQDLWLSPDCFTFTHAGRLFGREFSDPELVGDSVCLGGAKAVCAEFYFSVVQDHQYLLRKGLLIRLQHVLMLLPNVTTLGMRRGNEQPSWGWRHLKDRTGYDPRALGYVDSTRPPIAISESTLTFVGLMRAMASHITNLTELYTDAIEIDDLQPSFFRSKGMERALSRLRSLDLCACRGPTYPTAIARQSLPLMPTTFYGEGIFALLHAAKNVSHLGLSFFTIRALDEYTTRRETTYSFQGFKHSRTAICALNLNSLELDGVLCSSCDLLNTLGTQMNSLVHLKLRSIYVDVVEHFNVIEPEHSCSTLLHFLRDNFDHLESLHLCDIAWRQQQLTFDPEYRTGTPQWRYRPFSIIGKDDEMKAGLTVFAQNCRAVLDRDVTFEDISLESHE